MVSPTQYGRISFAGAASLGGAVSANLAGSFQPAVGDAFDVFSYTVFTGSFSGFNLPALLGGGQWAETYGPTKTTIRVSTGLPRLNVALGSGQLTLSWSTLADSGYAVQYATNLSPPILWLNATNAVQVSGEQKTVTIPTADDTKFFRLLK